MKLTSILSAFTALSVMCSCTPVTPENPDPIVKPEPKPDPEPQPEPAPLPEVVKVLAIGNSFSADAVEQELYPLIDAAGQKVIIGDLYIGGCPLEKHAANAASDAAAYSYRKIVNGTLTKTADVKMSTALSDEDWTFISVQEGAGYHGFYNTSYNGVTHSMEPDLTNLVKVIREHCPNATLVYHAPWVAKANYTGTKFSYYGFDQKKMYEMICTATQQVLTAHPEFKLFMNSMDAVENARSSYIGDNMTRDGWHMNYTTGRYTVGCLWFERIMGKSVVGNSYRPEGMSETTALVCQTAAHEACVNPYKVTDLSYFKKPEGEDGEQLNLKTLAQWYFTPERAKNDGCVQTWTGQTELGVYNYSNEPGERGYYNANGQGNGKISYVQVDKTRWTDKNSGLSILNVSNGGQPQMCGPFPGDYWQFETTGGNEFAEGTQLHIIYTYNPGNYGAKYWTIEYKDGKEFKPVPAFEMKKVQNTLASPAEEIDYNIAFTTEQKQVEFAVTLENPTTEFVVRQRCMSTYQVNDKWFDHPNIKCVSRIAGDPANEQKPLPTMSQVL